MSKFASASTRPNVQSPIATTGDRVLTHEGGIGYERDPKSALFLLAVSNMVGEQTFYESANARDERFESLVHQVTATDPDWLARFAPFLRGTMNMRTAALVLAAEYAAAKGTNARRVIASACQRADEPAELLAYWFARHGRKIPAAVKRGIADAAQRLYTERNYLRWNGNGNPWQMADVIELCHVKPRDEHQSALFRYILDARHGRADDTMGLVTIAADKAWLATPETERRGAVIPEHVSWERLSAWMPGGMDAAAWELVIPQMGYMALLRNLRNFDQAGVSDRVADEVARRLTDPDEVARSRQLPMRFLSAYKNAPSLRWAWPLERALDRCLANVPALDGRTLVMIDVSGSMGDRLSNRSELQRWEAAAVFGTALALRNQADLFIYGTNAAKVQYPLGASVLPIVKEIGQHVGGGTNTLACIHACFAGHDRVVVLTDEQAHDSGMVNLGHVPSIYTFNLAGYRPGHLPSGTRGRHTFGGLSDAAFTMLPLLERGSDVGWPF